jgi:hypothetical protein
MIKKIAIALTLQIILFLGYVSTKQSKFQYERSGMINAPADKIYPYLSNFKLGYTWNPYDQKDPNIKRNFKGTEGAVGSIMEFDGNAEAGTGTLELLKAVPNESSEIRLVMTKPIHADNLIQYKLIPEGTGTRFSWTMSGDGGFFGKLISVFIDCEKMVTKDFVVGIENLKKVVESQK